MSKSVVLIGMIEPSYDGPVTERWGINRTYQHQKDLTRLYFFDEAHLFGKDFIDEINRYETFVVTRKEHPEIDRSSCYPLADVMKHFEMNEPYFTCTAAYMIAHAIAEGYEEIILHGMYHIVDSLEYMHHKPCIEYWLGIAKGRGIKVEFSGDTSLCRPAPWQSPLYGYVRQLTEFLCISTLAASYRACLAYPAKWVNADEDDQPMEEKININNVLVSQAMDVVKPNGNL